MTLFYLIHKQNIIQTLQYNNINDNNNNNNDDNDNNNIETNKVKKERYNFLNKIIFFKYRSRDIKATEINQ